MTRVDAAEAQRMFHDGRPLAPLDVREAGQFGEGHALFAIPLPYSQLERRVVDLVPRLSERVLLIDQGDGVAEKAARRLAAAGYTNLHLLDRGMRAWEAAGFGVYKGVNVPSKLLGELAEAIWHPETVSADELARWQAEGRQHQLFDARPAEEYSKMRVPGAVCLPNGELPHHVARLGLGPETPVVITCAGRTRGIVGAIGLRLAGCDGPVHALENGTQGWALAGYALEQDNRADMVPTLDPKAEAASVAAGRRIMHRFDIPAIDAAAAEDMLYDDTRTTYLIDVRSNTEAEADPLPGALQAPCGQLVQATDQWVAVRHARVLLCCDTGLRSALAAFWLRQLGYEPFILFLAEARALARQPAPTRIAAPALDCIGTASAMAAIAVGAKVIDLRSSAAFRAGHVAGASWGMRPRLAGLVRKNPHRPVLILTDCVSDAAFAARDLAEAGVNSIRVIEGGVDAMRKAGAPIEATPWQPDDAARIDHLFFVHDRHQGNLAAARQYLAWETGLVAQLSASERAEFRLIYPGN
ncbi:rhodanese-like domain-containing protein [Paracoccus beibuensis]|uniref:rhodanese-like domain-containing protein n=1 Tax=Paracoccus beibuensis TaxID=547602 RepID=UPI00223F2FC0|nr:rhodanese-like domain-containing protein [Paracoccus beibuensis]